MRSHCLKRPRGDREPSGASSTVAAAVAMKPRVKVRMRTKSGAVELNRGQQQRQRRRKQQDSSPIVKSNLAEPKVAPLEMRVAKVKKSDQKAPNKMMVRDRLTLRALVTAICWQLVALSNCLVGGQFAPTTSVQMQTGANLPTLSSPSSETQIVRGLANWPGSRLELPCLVDQFNCGEVYYITWTKQTLTNQTTTTTAQSRGQQIVGAPASSKLPWNRVYLYTGANDSAPHKPIGDLQGRARFVMPEQGGVAVGRDNSQPMARLVIEEPRLSDEALYKCDVTYVKGKCPSISLVRVQMMALPERAQIFQVPSQRVDTPTLPRLPLTSGQMLGPLNEHDQLQLLCLVAGGRPAPLAVFWRKIDPTGRIINLAPSIGFNSDQQQQSRPTTTMSSNQVEVALNHTLTSADLGAKFECHVEHEALDSVVRPMARLISATGAHHHQPRRRPSEQNDALLDLHPAASSSINRHDSGAAETNSESSASELLDADPTTRSLDAHLTIDLNVGVQSLDLFVNKQQQAAPGRAGSDLKEGDLIELECVAYDSKPAANITWLNGSEVIGSGASGELELGSARRSVGAATGQRSQRNKRLLQRNLMQLNADGQTYNTHSFLSIKLSRHEHGAQISCQARNGAMRDSISKSTELQVQYAPIVLMEPANGRTLIEHEPREPTRPRPGTSVITSSEQRAPSAAPPVASGQDQAQIYCIYSANPFQLVASSTRWFKDGQLLSVTGERLAESTTQNGYPTLTINRVSRQDAGNYDCQLTNSVGTSERLAQSETSKLEVHFRPSVQMRAYKTSSSQDETLPSEQGRGELVDFERSLVMPNDEFELVCELLEANPNKIDKFHWFGSTTAQSQSGAGGTILRPLATSDGPRFKLGPLKANFTASLFACAATNSIGQSELSNTIELELSHTPGVSHVRPITSPRLKKLILSGGKTNGVTLQTDPLVGDLEQQHEPEASGRPISAGKELLLECVTRELGRPRANIWLWFRNGQTIGNESQSELRHEAASHSDGANEDGDQEDESEGAPDNPISDRSRQDLSSSSSAWSGRRNSTASSRRQRKRRSIQLLAFGRFLFIPSIQLAHKGNFSCVALNRLGPGGGGGGGGQSLTGASAGGRDSFELRPAQAPSFVQPLAPSTNWAETSGAAGGKAQLELVCRVQCEPICQLEWLRNNEPLDIKNANNNNDDPNRNHNYVAYHVRNTIFDEHEQANQFRSVESRLVLTFDENLANNNNQQPDKRPALVVDRDWLLARRHFLNSSNLTCQSGHNSMGPPVRSTTRLVVQYPPENVLISAPSDKLNLVEGSRGPMLSCEASGEPQVQYRWLLLRSGAQLGSASVITSSDLVAARYNVKHSPGSNATGPSQQNKKSNGALQANDRTGETTTAALADNNNNNQADGRLVQLTGLSEGEQVGGTSVSMLDLAGISMDRKQSGHYICEASNGLGQTRQSIHVNVLYKPSCVTLHMHSLDLTALARPNLVFANRPNGQANKDEEYALVSESSDDFIGLRKLLVMSPLLASGILTRDQNLDKFSLSASMFGAMLETAQAAKQQQQHQLQRPPVRERPDGSSSLLPIGGDLRDGGGDSAQSSPIWSSPATASERPSGAPDAWAKFNEILVKFLNDYSKLIKLDEERRLRAGSSSSGQPDQAERRRHDETTRRRSSGSSAPAANDDLNSSEPAAPSNRLDDNQQPTGGVKRTNMLTFACMAQEANPMVNLTFEWYFGAVRLVATSQQVTSDFIDNSLDGAHEQAVSQHETTIYSNANETLSIVLTRRLDSGATLSPFQVSFITVNVVLNSAPASGIVRDGDDELQSGSSPASQTSAAPNGSLLLKAPVIRSRYQSFYQANLQANNLNGPAEQLRRRSSGGNSKLASNGPQQIESIEISEFNWRDRLAQLLSCSVSNSVGTSDACYVRPLDRNALKRRKQLDELNGASSYELAKWRMPSLAQKSVLIISVLIGCSLIVFATFALLLGPHLRAMQSVQKKRRLDESAGNIHSNVSSSSTTSTKDQDQNTIHTANSTSSQKSSVLGLLGNAAEHSFPSGSSSSNSDDDSTTNRLNQLDSRQLARRAEARASHFDYDLPRNNSTATEEPKLVYRPDAGCNFGQDQVGCYENYRFHYDNELQQAPSKSSGATSSAGGRILASLKSKFKVQDRIGDLPNGRWSGLLHARNVSNSETATTGLSLDKSLNVSATTNSANQHTTATLQSGRSLQQSLGVPANLRHSYAGARPSHYRHLAAYKQQHHQQQPPLTMAKSGLHYPTATMLNDQTSGSSGGFNEATYNRLLQLNSQVLIKQTMDNTMQNQHHHQQQEPLNAMDEFMRNRGFDTAGDFEQDQLGETAIAYGTQSIRNKSSSIYALRNDLIQLTTTTSQLPAARSKQPVYPRASQSYGLTSRPQQQPAQNYQISAMFKPMPPAPMVAARNGRGHQMFDFRHQNSTFLEHNLTAPYSESNASLMQTATPQRFDTIDAHLNRFANNTLAYYNANGQFDQHQLAYANTFDLNQHAQFSQQRQFGGGLQSNLSTNKDQPIEHIYDTNAYATPEQTPARRQNATANQPNVGRQDQANSESERLRVSQLIQTFNTKLPENSP